MGTSDGGRDVTAPTFHPLSLVMVASCPRPHLWRITAWRDDETGAHWPVAVIYDTTLTQGEAVSRAVLHVRADPTLDPSLHTTYLWTCEEMPT